MKSGVANYFDSALRAGLFPTVYVIRLFVGGDMSLHAWVGLRSKEYSEARDAPRSPVGTHASLEASCPRHHRDALLRRALPVLVGAAALGSLIIAPASPAHATTRPPDPAWGSAGQADVSVKCPVGTRHWNQRSFAGADGALYPITICRKGNTKNLSVLITRLTPSGHVDLSFGNAGTARRSSTVPDPDWTDWKYETDVHGNGYLTQYSMEPQSFPATQTLVRFTRAGQIDRNFGTKAIPVTRAYPWSNLLVDSSGRPLTFTSKASDDTLKIRRWTTSGRPDPTFGTDGVRVLHPPRTRYAKESVIPGVSPDGNKLIISYEGWDAGHPHAVILARLTGRGAMDHTFGTRGVTGYRITNSGNVSTSVVLDPTGRPTVRASNGHLYRFSTAGKFDAKYARSASRIKNFGYCVDAGAGGFISRAGSGFFWSECRVKPYDYLVINSSGKIIATITPSPAFADPGTDLEVAWDESGHLYYTSFGENGSTALLTIRRYSV